MAKKRHKGAAGRGGATAPPPTTGRPVAGDPARHTTLTSAQPTAGDSIPAAFRRTTPRPAARAAATQGLPSRRPLETADGGSARPTGLQPVDEHVEYHGLAARMQSAGDDVVPHGVAVPYVFDTRHWTAPSSVEIRFVGARVDGSGLPGDTFERVERLDELHPGTGRVAVTARVQGINPGRWRVTAGPVQNPPGAQLPSRTVAIATTLAPLAQGPAVRVMAWPALVALGAVVAVAMQALLVARSDLPVATVVGLSLVACLVGFVGGKVWFLVAKRRPLREFFLAGAYVQGFLLVALSVLFLGAVLADLPPLEVLDATAPGIFFGMAVGRPGCFLTGCCTGRPTLSRWGLWSSDRRLAVRRVPVQLLEAGAALAIGLICLALVLAGPPPVGGSILAAGVAAYTLCRQFLFPLRAQSHTVAGRLRTQAICGVILTAVAISFVLH